MINDLWHKNAIVYCLSVGTYLDTNADGIGDFQGLLRRLDYLQGLGVTAIWLLPFQPTPGRDDGYDVSDYYGVDPRYGSLGDFVEFTQGCRQRGLRVLIDLVVNHTSNQHPWFQEARKDSQSKYRDWYIWSKKKPRNANKGMVFPGVQKSTWNYDEVAKAWYFHRFYDFQPDLNTSNPEVQAEILKIMGDSAMSNLVILFIHFLATLARLLGPGGVRSIVAEFPILKHPLLIVARSRQRDRRIYASQHQ